MTAKDQLIKILNNAVLLGASDIHFTLEYTGLILIQYRSGNLMLPTTLITTENYKQIIKYINLHTIFQPFHKGQSQSGKLIIKDYQTVFECRVSILPTAKFKSLVLRIKKPKTKSNNCLKSYLEIVGASFLNNHFFKSDY